MKEKEYYILMTLKKKFYMRVILKMVNMKEKENYMINIIIS